MRDLGDTGPMNERPEAALAGPIGPIHWGMGVPPNPMEP